MIDMTRNNAAAITRALNDIEDFEIFMEQVEHVFHEIEGNLSGFYYDELLPLMKKELRTKMCHRTYKKLTGLTYFRLILPSDIPAYEYPAANNFSLFSSRHT